MPPSQGWSAGQRRTLNLDEAAAFWRVHALMERAGGPDHMTIDEAIAAGLLS